MIVLASKSPRRKELLGLLTKDFIVMVSDVDETSQTRDPKELVCELAQKKARAVAQIQPDSTVIGADTVVELGGEIFGKPKDTADAGRMMRALRGCGHLVHTGVCVIHGGQERVQCVSTRVHFSEITDAELNRYLEQAKVLDKAGAYAIQEDASKFVKGIEGCYFNVVGLPVHTLYTMLRDMGVL